MLDKQFWEQRHKESKGRYNRVTDYAKFCYDNFLKGKKGRLLDLGCGKGADCIFFHRKGFRVSGVDYSIEAINQFNEIQEKLGYHIHSMLMNMADKFPFEDDSFDFVYSRAGLYYFTHDELVDIVSEIKRVLKSEGMLLFQVKNVHDKGYGDGKELENDMFEDDSGYVRHYFSKEYAEDLLEGFTLLLNEERRIPNGSVYLEVVAVKK